MNIAPPSTALRRYRWTPSALKHISVQLRDGQPEGKRKFLSPQTLQLATRADLEAALVLAAVRQRLLRVIATHAQPPGKTIRDESA